MNKKGTSNLVRYIWLMDRIAGTVEMVSGQIKVLALNVNAGARKKLKQEACLCFCLYLLALLSG